MKTQDVSYTKQAKQKKIAKTLLTFTLIYNYLGLNLQNVLKIMSYVPSI